MAVLTNPSSIPRSNPAASFRRNPSAPWRHLDVGLVGATIAVALLGVLMVYSATRATHGTSFLAKQAMFFVIGLGVLAVSTVVDYRRVRDLAPVLYGACLLLLLAVLSPLGATVNGSQSWFSVAGFQIQPSEFTKLAVILLLAAVCERSRGRLTGGGVFTTLVLGGIPLGLILLQPDVGSGMVFIAIIAALLLVAGTSTRVLVALMLTAVVGVIGIFQLNLIQDYQKARLTQFASPGGDTSGTGYNVAQSKITIGAGGLLGAGLFKGTQTKLRYVPEQQSDFIFTVVGEELGFIGCATLLLLYALIAWRTWRAAQVAKDLLGTLVCVGVLAMLLFQVFENVGMTMGIMPVTGIPLPFMSYGGSSTIMMFAAIGLVLNVHTRRFS
ncbi:MAG: rod shape determining protein RodA [Actinomycetota bacterium]|jgi:rod shape determining protein RodA|nr:rod shape determining protein RodA [Actinomycetota bacterium]